MAKAMASALMAGTTVHGEYGMAPAAPPHATLEPL
jgi:hypothetical protein